MPESIEIISDKFGETVEEQIFEEGETVLISLRKLVEFHIESDFIGKMQEKISQTDKELRLSVDKIKDVVNLTNFNLENLESDLSEGITPSMQVEAILKNTSVKLDTGIESISKIKQDLLDSTSKFLTKTFYPLSSYIIIKSSKELSSHVREHEGKKVVSKYASFKNKASQWVQKNIVKAFYKRSEGILFAQKVTAGTKKEITVNDYFLLSESITPSEEMLRSIPFYYKKLFSGRSSVGNEFWIGRSRELNECGEALKRFRFGEPGGLLVIGEKNSGKSSLSKHFAENELQPKSYL